MSELVSEVKDVSQAMIRKTLSYRYAIYVVVAMAYFFVYFHRTSTAVMAPELTKAFDLAPTALGLFGSMYFYAYALGQLPAGILADRWGARKTMTLFVAIAGLGAVLFGLSASFNLALTGRFLVGLGVGFVYVPALRLLADWFKREEFATYSGILVAIGNIGSLAAAAPLVILMAVVGWKSSMIAVGVVSLFIAVLDYLLIRNKPSEVGGASIDEIEGRVSTEAAPPVMGIGESLAVIVKSYNIWVISVLLFIFYGTLMGFQGLWAGPYLMNVYGMTKAEIGKLLMMIPIGMIIGSPLWGFISDKVLKSRKKVVFWGMLFYTLTWIPMIWMIDSMSPGFLAFVFFLYGFFGACFPVTHANVRENVDLQIAGTATGFLNTFAFIGGAIFQQIMAAIIASKPVVIAGVIPIAAFKSTFLFCFIIMIVGLAIFSTQKEKAQA